MRIDLEGLSHADRDALKAVLAPCLEAAGLDPRAGEGDVTRLQAPSEDGLLLIGYSTPGAHVARGLYYAVEPDPALAEWSQAADAACRLADAAPDDGARTTSKPIRIGSSTLMAPNIREGRSTSNVLNFNWCSPLTRSVPSDVSCRTSDAEGKCRTQDAERLASW